MGEPSRTMPVDFDFVRYSDDELLQLWNRISVVLRQRGVCRTKNIVSDVAERIVAQKLGLTLAPNSTRGYDATGPNGERYQIKARLWNAWNRSTQLGDIHHLDDGDPFDFLIAVVFSDGFPCAHAAYKIPLTVVRQFSRKKGKRDVLMARGPVLTALGVENITAQLGA
jgi:hypothetical protein